MPSVSVSIASEALRVIAISSGSHPNSAARSRRTDSIRGSSTFHMWCTGISLEKRRSRIIASSTWDGAGLQPPLFRLMSVRSESNARAISDQDASGLGPEGRQKKGGAKTRADSGEEPAAVERHDHPLRENGRF